MEASLISGVISASSPDAFAGGQSTTAQPNNQAGSATNQEDTAKLSPTAQALQLYHDGESVEFIARTLDLSVATVDSYLNLQVSAAATANASGETAPAPSVKV